MTSEKRYTPDELLEILRNTLLPKDQEKRSALNELIRALEAPDDPDRMIGNSPAAIKITVESKK